MTVGIATGSGLSIRAALSRIRPGALSRPPAPSRQEHPTPDIQGQAWRGMWAKFRGAAMTPMRSWSPAFHDKVKRRRENVRREARGLGTWMGVEITDGGLAALAWQAVAGDESAISAMTDWALAQKVKAA